jgi:hypothetical protein
MIDGFILGERRHLVTCYGFKCGQMAPLKHNTRICRQVLVGRWRYLGKCQTGELPDRCATRTHVKQVQVGIWRHIRTWMTGLQLDTGATYTDGGQVYSWGVVPPGQMWI